nr:hypothetical protein [Tanacetum cinerariifolium]
MADKKEFLSLVKEEWKEEVQGCHMYKLVKKLKKLSRPLKKLSWKQGFVFDNVVALKKRLKTSKDEMKILQQKAKVKWLKEDDDDVSYKGKAIPEQFVKHFEKFLGKFDQVVNVDDGLFKSILNSEEANNMICDVTDRDIKEVMFEIESNKASGLDGYTSEFFKKSLGCCWK